MLKLFKKFTILAVSSAAYYLNKYTIKNEKLDKKLKKVYKNII